MYVLPQHQLIVQLFPSVLYPICHEFLFFVLLQFQTEVYTFLDALLSGHNHSFFIFPVEAKG